MDKKKLVFLILIIFIFMSITYVNAADNSTNISNSSIQNQNTLTQSNYNTNTLQNSKIKLNITNKNLKTSMTLNNFTNNNKNNKLNLTKKTYLSNKNKISTRNSTNNFTLNSVNTYNSTKTIKNTTNNTSNNLKISSNVIYFNASVIDDNGDGSKLHPWKSITQTRIDLLNNDTTVYLANGKYLVYGTINIKSNINFVGENTNNTVIYKYYYNEAFKIYNNTKVSMNNLSLKVYESAIYNSGSLSLDHILLCNSTSYIKYLIKNYGSLNLLNSYFINNTLYNDCNVLYNLGKTNIKNTTFMNNNEINYGMLISSFNNLTINNSKFINNSAKMYAGAIYVLNSYLNVNNSEFNYNKANYAGSIYLDNSTAYLYNTKFIKSNSYRWGGAIGAELSKVFINNCEFINNTATNDVAGAVYSRESEVTITDSNFTSNTATFGGSICQLDGKLYITNTDFNASYVKYNGGAIYDIYADIQIYNSTFTNNNALNGGAIYVDNATSYFVVTYSLFNSNIAKSNGGAIFSNQNFLTITYNTFLDNQASKYNDITDQYPITTIINNNQYNTTKIMNITDSIVVKPIVINIGSIMNKTNVLIPISYDLRDYGYVTPVKNQVNGGNCWAFAAIASLESCVLKSTGINYNLSEENMKNLMAKYSSYGWYDYLPNDGGYQNMVVGYLTSWLGPINSTDDEYADYSTISPVLNSIMHVQDVYYIPSRGNYTNNSLIKEAILNYGAVFTNMYMSSYSFLNENTSAYYCNNAYQTNHMVAIVGWDDNYSKNNFQTTPAGDGAFIIKNSWGTNWGDNGYCYVSYYDKSFTTIYDPDTYSGFVFILNNTNIYDNIYQYDISGNNYFTNYGTDTLWYSNTFTSNNNDQLAAFSTYSTNGTENYTVTIYVNNKLKYTQNGQFTYDGYHTVKLNKYVQLNKGDIFKIELKVSAKDIAYIPMEYASISRISPGNNYSYIKTYEYDEDENQSPNVVCLKAFTINNDKYFDAKANNDNGDGSQVHPWKTITQTRINSLSNDSIVYIKNGTYYIPNTITINSNIKFMGDNKDNTIIDGNNSGQSIFIINSNTTFERLKIRNVNTNTATNGAITNNGNITLSNLIFTNTSSINGAAIYNNKEATIKNSIFTNSTVINNGVIYSKGKITISNNTFINIKATTETLYISGISSITNNKYINCSMYFDTISITGNNQSNINQPITIYLTVKLAHPQFYDQDILNKTTLLIYQDNNLIKTMTGIQNYNITSNSTGTTSTCIKLSISQKYSNTKNILIGTNNSSIILINPINAQINDTIQINATIKTISGNIISDGTIYFKINGKTIKDSLNNTIKISVVNGTAQLSYTVPDLWYNKNLTIQAYYIGKSYDNGISNKEKIIVTKQTSTITQIIVKSNATSIISGDKITLTAMIKDKYGNNITGGWVIFKLQGKTIKDPNGNIIKTNVTMGIVEITYQLPNDISQRNYTITAVYSGNNLYNITKKDTKVEIKKISTIITVNATQKNNTIIVIGSIKDKNGHYLIGTNNVVFKVNGITINNITTNKTTYLVKNGLINYTIIIPGWRKGKIYNNLTVVTGERNAYLSTRATTKILYI